MILSSEWMRHGLACLGVVAFFAGCTSNETRPDDDAQAQVERARALTTKYEAAVADERSGNYRDAYTKFMEIQGSDPDYSDLSARLERYRDLVVIQQDIEDLQDEPAQLRASYHVDFGEALRSRGPFYREQSRNQYQAGLELFEESFDGHFGLASLYLESGYLAEALEHFTRASAIGSDKLNRSSLAYYNLAVLHRSTTVEGADKSLAVVNARQAVEYAAGEAMDMRRLLAEVLMEAGLAEEALKVAEDVAGREEATEGDAARVARFKNGGQEPAKEEPKEAATEEGS